MAFLLSSDVHAAAACHAGATQPAFYAVPAVHANWGVPSGAAVHACSAVYAGSLRASAGLLPHCLRQLLVHVGTNAPDIRGRQSFEPMHRMDGFKPFPVFKKIAS